MKNSTILWEDYTVFAIYYDEDDVEHETDVGEITLPMNVNYDMLPEEITIAGFVWRLEGKGD